MSRQDNLNLPFCALWNECLLNLWKLLSDDNFVVLKDWVIVPLPLCYEPSAKALVFSGLDVETISSND